MPKIFDPAIMFLGTLEGLSMSDNSNRILVVEDDQDIRTMIEAKLSAKNIDFEFADSVKQAILKIDEVPFKAISLDISLGDENAAQIIDHMSKNSNHINRRALFVIFSQHVNEEFKINMRKRRIDAFSKDSEIDQYFEWVYDLMIDTTIDDFSQLLEDGEFDEVANDLLDVAKLDTPED